MKFAKVHHIALVNIIEGKYTYETRGAGGFGDVSRDAAGESFGLPRFVGVCYGPATGAGWPSGYR